VVYLGVVYAVGLQLPPGFFDSVYSPHTKMHNKLLTLVSLPHTRLTALFRDYPGEPVQKGKTNVDFTEARDSELL